MSLNIGLSMVANRGRKNTISMDDLYVKYMAAEHFQQCTDRMFSYGEQLHTALENIISLGKVAAKYTSTEAMVVLNELVKDDFHGRLTLASLEEAGAGIWAKIKYFFKRCKDWLVYAAKEAMGLVKALAAAIALGLVKLREKTTKFRPFKYKGFDLLAGKTDPSNFMATGNLTAPDAENILEDAEKLLESEYKERTVETEEDAKKVFAKCSEMGPAVMKIWHILNKGYIQATGMIREGETDDNAEMAKLAMKILNRSLKLGSKAAWYTVKTMFSVAINSKIVPKEKVPDTGAAGSKLLPPHNQQ